MTDPSSHAGVDFGTSNSAIALATTGADVDFVKFSLLGAESVSARTLLYFDPDEQEIRLPIQYHAGPRAIEAYLDALGEGRLVQSFKTHLTSISLGRTQIGHHAVSLDDMVALYFLRLRQHAAAQLGRAPSRVVLGRPVAFAGAENEEMNDKAQQRLGEAAITAGFEEVRFELEPIAAAYHYERQLEGPELALVADFGAGTTDFCLMRLGPDRTEAPDREADIIGSGGIGVAGDDLDAAIIEQLVCPRLGRGTTYVEMGKEHAVPNSYYFKLARWHHLSFLRTKRVRAELERLHQFATDPGAIENLLYVVDNNQGFHLHKAVERLKIALSSHATASFSYCDGPVAIEVDVQRSEFESWIAEHVQRIAGALDDTLSRAGLAPADVDSVFLTGGTAFVPAIRRQFEARFGAGKLRSGSELLSIASGLALRAKRLWGF